MTNFPKFTSVLSTHRFLFDHFDYSFCNLILVLFHEADSRKGEKAHTHRSTNNFRRPAYESQCPLASCLPIPPDQDGVEAVVYMIFQFLLII